jgi:hypothetical protein
VVLDLFLLMIFHSLIIILLCLYLFAQLIIEGIVTEVSEKESEKYFHSRPTGSQLGAIVSKQFISFPYFCCLGYGTLIEKKK